MSPADLDDIGKGLRFLGQTIAERLDRGKQMGTGRFHGSDVHRSRKNVIRGLPSIHVVVRMEEPLSAPFAAEELAPPIGEHLVHVHIRLRPASRLPDQQRKLVTVLTGEHLFRRPHDRVGLGLVESPQVPIHESTGLLHENESLNQLAGHALVGNSEVATRTLGLHSPEAFVRNLDIAQRVAFDSSHSNVL